MAAYLAELRCDYLYQTLTERCRIDGSFDGVEFDDSGPDVDSEFARLVSAGDTLAVSDEAGALGSLVPTFGSDPGEESPIYGRDLPDKLDNRDVVGALSVDAPGDELPGLDLLTLTAPTLARLPESLTAISGYGIDRTRYEIEAVVQAVVITIGSTFRPAE